MTAERQLLQQALVLSRTWWDRDEASFVLRTISGALSRSMIVEIVTPGEVGMVPDGLFDVRRRGPAPLQWSEVLQGLKDEANLRPTVVITDISDEGAAGAARRTFPSAQLITVGPGGAFDPARDGLPLTVSSLAEHQPHNGFGFTDYLLVLTNRPAGLRRSGPVPPAAGSWLIAGFPRRRTVLIQDGDASAWWGRALRGIVHVDTRTDLQRLIAHASVTIDLAPGPLVARESVESLMLGTPVVAPAGSVPVAAARYGGVLPFSDIDSLFAAVRGIFDDSTRRRLSEEGRRFARMRFADQQTFTGTVQRFASQY